MKVILSPAKSLDFEKSKKLNFSTEPYFIKDSVALIKSLKKLKPKAIMELMDVSMPIAELNYDRFQKWNYPFSETEVGFSLFVFTGEAYRGLDAATLSEKEIEVAQSKLRILSGLYGILKPSDLILPYRLEMSTSHKFSSKTNSLYSYWGDKLRKHLENEMISDEILVNVASNEYSKALQLSKFKHRVINCHFKEGKNGEYKAIMTFAKKARGMMARFIIQNNIEEIEHLKAFDSDGYHFNNELSSENEFVFTR
jgi:cytoplasmic iron level regulating protein YaaA (DUF328/UPF0246 family)